MRLEALLPLSFAFLLVASGCVTVTPEDGLDAASATTDDPTGFLLVNATVWTADEDRPWATAVAVRGDRIVTVGTDVEVLAADVGETPRVVDLQGRLLLPGFHDTHNHLIRVARDADPSGGNPFAPWPPGWDPLTGTLGQQVVAAGHVGTYGERNVDRMLGGGEPFPPDDAHASTHRHGMTDLGPWTGEGNDREDREAMMHLALDTSARFGITSHVEAGAPLDETFRLLEAMEEDGELSARFNVYIFPEDLDAALERNLTTGWGSDRARLLGLKIYSDGWMGPRTAALRDVYEDRPHRGFIFYGQDEVDELTLRAHRGGLKVTAHTIGDRAVDRLLTGYERALAEGCAPEVDHVVCADPRFSLEHAQLTPPDLLERMAAAGVVPSIQLSFATSDAPWAEDALGEERLDHAYAWRTMLAHGLRVGGSSDFPIEVLPPLWGIQRMVTRMDLTGEPAGGFLPDERVTLHQALRMITIDAAYLEHREDELGSLEEGKLADLVVLDRNLFEIPPETIHQAQVDLTMVDGEVVYADPGTLAAGGA